MFGSSLPSIVCKRAHVVLCYLCLFAHSGVQHILCCILLRIVYPTLSVSLDCPLLIAPSVFSNVYLQTRISIKFIYIIFSEIYSS